MTIRREILPSFFFTFTFSSTPTSSQPYEKDKPQLERKRKEKGKKIRGTIPCGNFLEISLVKIKTPHQLSLDQG
jgi:hypothetical protein